MAKKAASNGKNKESGIAKNLHESRRCVRGKNANSRGSPKRKRIAPGQERNNCGSSFFPGEADTPGRAFVQPRLYMDFYRKRRGR